MRHQMNRERTEEVEKGERETERLEERGGERHESIIPATREAEAGESLEPGRWRLQ